MARIEVRSATKRFGTITAVNQLSLEIADGEFFTLLGPPGAGKTTTLRLIVGLEHPDEGSIWLDGEDVTEVYPGKRDIAMIFQNLALYPNRSAFENMAYPLRERKLPEAEIRQTVSTVAKTLHIEHLLERRPGQLSGGERQRVAIGRAIVRRPRAYLMDEPLSALDAMLRLEMRVELKRLQRELGQTLVYVTHDQVEAMSMSDRIGVLHKGVLQQVDAPAVIYHRPLNRFVATTIGSPPMNFIACRIVGERLEHPAFSAACGGHFEISDPERVEIGIRPENVAIHFAPAGDRIAAVIFVIEPLGAESVIDLDLGDGVMIKAVVPSPFLGQVGQRVWLTFDGAAISLLDSVTDQFVFHSSDERPLHIASADMAANNA
ncbi:MAG: ABC transporter ATP-binding protein [Aggregatilineales bacterium]